jgi:hypothetical protein
MAKIPKALHGYINGAFPDNVCLLGTVLKDGFANISPRGRTQVFDDETLAVWDRGGRSSSESLENGTKLTVYLRDPALGSRGNGMLPAGGIARFFGTAELHHEGEAYEQVWNNMVERERESDPEKKGFAVLIRVERAEDLLSRPLPEDLAAKED